MLYISLAETHAYQGQIDSFYYYLEYALKKGYKTQWLILENGADGPVYENPISLFVNEQRFIDLIEKYRTSQPLKG